MKTNEEIRREIDKFYEENGKSYETLCDLIIDGNNIDDCFEIVKSMMLSFEDETLAIMTYRMMKFVEKLNDKLGSDEEIKAKMEKVVDIMDELEEAEDDEEDEEES